MKVIITGGAGFIGSNAASRYLRQGHKVVVVDDLSRPGVERNLAWLKDQGPLTFLKVDIRQARETQQVFQDHRDADLVLHLAGQVAVTTSVLDPRTDFEVNALGTLNVLEGVRHGNEDTVAVSLFLDEQGLRRHGGRGGRGDRRPLSVP